MRTRMCVRAHARTHAENMQARPITADHVDCHVVVVEKKQAIDETTTCAVLRDAQERIDLAEARCEQLTVQVR